MAPLPATSVSALHQIGALIRKDLTLFFRNRFFGVVTLLGLVFYIIIYYFLPTNVDESLRLVFYTQEQFPILADIPENEALIIDYVDSQAELEQAVLEEDYHAGITWSPVLPEQVAAGEKGQINIYFAGDTPQEMQEAVQLLMREVILDALGFPIHIEENTTILGPNRVGDQIPLRDRMIPLIAVMIMLVEMLGLSSLISEEIETRTLTALLVTPLTVSGLMLAKGITGVGLAFGQATILMLVTGSLGRQTMLILAVLLLGAVMVTGLGFLIAARAKDLISVIAWGIPGLLILSIPPFAVLLPGLATGWVKLIPSYYLAETIYQAANFNAGWDELWPNLLILLAFNMLIGGLGVLALRRKTR